MYIEKSNQSLKQRKESDPAIESFFSPELLGVHLFSPSQYFPK